MLSTMILLAAIATTPAVATSQQRPPVSPPAAAPAGADLPASPSAVTRRITWDRNTDADLAGYIVSWGDKPGLYSQSKRVGPGETSTELEVPSAHAAVYVAVRAVDRAGVPSGYSNEIAIGQTGRHRSPNRAPASTTRPARRERSAEEKAEARRKKQERKKRLKAARAAASKG